jgi:hypothetical protein
MLLWTHTGTLSECFPLLLQSAHITCCIDQIMGCLQGVLTIREKWTVLLPVTYINKYINGRKYCVLFVESCHYLTFPSEMLLAKNVFCCIFHEKNPIKKPIFFSFQQSFLSPLKHVKNPPFLKRLCSRPHPPETTPTLAHLYMRLLQMVSDVLRPSAEHPTQWY